MRKTASFVVAAAIILISFCAVGNAQAQAPYAGTCTPVKIQTGTVLASTGQTLKTGYDEYGYNYIAHLFNGLSENYSRPSPPNTEGLDTLVMKWSDDWLANITCAEDSTRRLARGYANGTATGISMGWCTNHYEGDYQGGDGEYYHYTYFVKIVYDNGAACSQNLSSCIWNNYQVIEEVYNDPKGEAPSHGVNRNALVNPAGLGVVR